MRTSEPLTVLTVSDLKQFAYCPRIVYYSYCLPLIRPVTFKMERGAAAHAQAGEKEHRRTLKAYGLSQGERQFDVWLSSAELGLRGRVDMVIETDDNASVTPELIPVEYKNSRREAGAHWKQQVAAYGMMVEEMRGLAVRRGFVYYLPLRRAEETPITARLRAAVRETVGEMRRMIEREAMPEAPKSQGQCVDCEFRRFCNDVL